jgi:N6-adenosine-specific RNA methylase IME4
MNELDKLSQAERMLAEVATVEDALNVVDFAEAARVFAQRAKLGTHAMNHATTVKVRAERRLADVVDEGQSAGVIAVKGKPAKPPEGGGYPSCTLKSLGVKQQRLTEARLLRDAYSDSDVLALAAYADESDRELSRKTLIKQARSKAIGNAPAATSTVDGEVGTIVADPPWRYGNTSTRGAAQDHYPTMSIDEIADLKVAHEHTGEQAHLYLWSTAGHLPQAFEVMAAWGFTYKTYLVWIKPQMGMGNYFRVSTELVLFGTKGELRTRERNIMNYFTERRGKHSAKPESFYDMVMKASPGPYLEMFARCRKSNQLICGCARCRLDWQVWGNES